MTGKRLQSLENGLTGVYNSLGSGLTVAQILMVCFLVMLHRWMTSYVWNRPKCVFFFFLQTSSRVDAIQLYYEKKSKIQKGSQKGFNTLQDTYTPTLKHTYTHKTAHTGPYRRMILFLLLYIFGTLAPLFCDRTLLHLCRQCCLLLLLLHQVNNDPNGSRENLLIAIKIYTASLIAIKNNSFPYLPSICVFCFLNCHHRYIYVFYFLNCHLIT